jgi:hypothetical protein
VFHRYLSAHSKKESGLVSETILKTSLNIVFPHIHIWYWFRYFDTSILKTSKSILFFFDIFDNSGHTSHASFVIRSTPTLMDVYLPVLPVSMWYYNIILYILYYVYIIYIYILYECIDINICELYVSLAWDSPNGSQISSNEPTFWPQSNSKGLSIWEPA